jgi:hypothetical protein
VNIYIENKVIFVSSNIISKWKIKSEKLISFCYEIKTTSLVFYCDKDTWEDFKKEKRNNNIDKLID